MVCVSIGYKASNTHSTARTQKNTLTYIHTYISLKMIPFKIAPACINTMIPKTLPIFPRFHTWFWRIAVTCSRHSFIVLLLLIQIYFYINFQFWDREQGCAVVVEPMEYSFPQGSSGGRLQCSQECHCSKETSCYPTKVCSFLLH